jgi:hypothetical protein
MCTYVLRDMLRFAEGFPNFPAWIYFIESTEDESGSSHQFYYMSASCCTS